MAGSFTRPGPWMTHADAALARQLAAAEDRIAELERVVAELAERGGIRFDRECALCAQGTCVVLDRHGRGE